MILDFMLKKKKKNQSVCVVEAVHSLLKNDNIDA